MYIRTSLLALHVVRIFGRGFWTVVFRELRLDPGTHQRN